MIQATSTMLVNTPYDGATCSKNSSRLRKRKLSSPASFDKDERKMLTNKKRKKTEDFFDDIIVMDCDFSIDLDLPEDPVKHSSDDDVFDWMQNILSNSDAETSVTQGIDKNNKGYSDSNGIDSFLTFNESDPCYEEMISLLAEGDKDGNDEENVFKKIQESFISDRLLGQHFFSSASSLRNADHSKSQTIERSPSLNTRRNRSSRIGIRQGFAKLVKANSRSARTRHMLLNCKLSFCKNTSQ